MTARQSLPPKNNDIEILRAFAILYTVVLHLKVLLPGNSALLSPLRYLDLSVGVDLFLVISGFVITGSIMESTRRRGVARRPLMLSFWIKRIFRLLPAAWTWVVIAVIAQLLIMATTDSHYAMRDVLLNAGAALGNFMNIYTPYCVANGGGQACLNQNFVGHYWSLSLEEQFYLVFPFLFFFLKRRALVVFLVSAIVLQFMWQRPFFTYAWYFKTDALCWGILLALLARSNFYQRHQPALLRTRSIAAATGLALLAFLPAMAMHIQGIATQMQPYGVAVVALACASIVWLASYDRDVFTIGGRYQRVMLYLGSRSYSLYLSHLVVYLSTRDLLGPFNADLLALAGPAGLDAILIVTAASLTLLGAELTYRFIESAVRARGRLIAERLLASAPPQAAQPTPP